VDLEEGVGLREAIGDRSSLLKKKIKSINKLTNGSGVV
jgi:hypothetical protein